MLRAHLTVGAFGLLGLFATAGLTAQDCHIPLRGLVLDAETHEPMPYASIHVLEVARGVQSDETGAFLVPDLCAGTTYTVEVYHVGCLHQTQVVQLQENQVLKFELQHGELLSEVIVSQKAYTPPPIQAEVKVRSEDLAAAQGLNLGETLRRLPGVSTLNTGATISKPVIQGLHSNRIAIVQNGLAIEGQQWGSEHAPEVDPFTANSVRVVKGAAGLQYGVGAMAGAVVLEPAPLRDTAGVGGWLALGGFSNGIGCVASAAVDVKPKDKPLACRLQGTVKKSGNLRAPEYWLGNTGAVEFNLSAMAAWKTPRWTHELSGSRFDQQIGILRAAHIGNLSDLEAAIESDTPRNNRNVFAYNIDRPYQDVQHTLGQYHTTFHLTDVWKLSGRYAVQFNRRREFDVVRSTGSAANKPQLAFDLWTNTLDLSAEHLPIRHWQGGAGLQMLQQTNSVSKGGLIPDYTAWGASVWAAERWRRYPKPWEVEFGFRYDYRQTHATTLGNLNNLDTTVQFGNLSGTAGVAYHFGPHLRLQLHSGYAWRPPHVNELFARGVHHGSATYEQGRSDLTPEKAWNNQLTLSYAHAEKAVTLTVYRNQVQDFMYLDPQNTFVLTIRGAFPAYFYTQADAVLQGLDLSVDWPLFAGLVVEGRASLLRGFRVAVDSGDFKSRHNWLPLMPTDRFQYGLRYTLKTNANGQSSYIRMGATTALQQTRIPEVGLLKPAPGAFTLLSFDAAHTVLLGKKPLELGISIQNLGNLRYREYLNFFRYYADETGVNAGLRAKWIF